MALTKTHNRMIEGAHINALDYMSSAQIADVTGNTGSVDVTAAIQAAVDDGLALHKKVFLPAGKYKVTSTITLYDGTQLLGEGGYAYGAGFSRDPKATKISFEPVVTDDLFDYQYDTTPTPTPTGFLFHTSINGLYLIGNANARRAININDVIYGSFKLISIDGFDTGIFLTGTINNRFESIFISGCDNECVRYNGSTETSDVWNSCTFFGSPVGVVMAGTTVGIRFDSCLFEQLDNYGIDLAREVQSCMVTNSYSEDVPYDTAQSDAAMFRVGHAGTTTVISNHLIVTGGLYQGRTAGLHGSLFDINHCNGVVATGFSPNRYVNILKTDASNTLNNSVVINGYAGISWTNNILDADKVSGTFANSVINSGVFHQNSRFGNVTGNTGFIVGSSGYGISFASTCIWTNGPASPEGAVTAPIGSLWTRTDGSTSTTLYVKESGTGNTGWVAK